ncbi:MAG TPA: response regulator [Candidatus Dormibacteraeota bacterium]|nr:response regulator [Candidatus Dormibacteraeota bacterium]
MFRPNESDLDNPGVLFIEDDPRISELYRLKLEADGYLVQIVSSDGAVGAAQAHRPEIIFLDLSSGILERLDVLRDVRRAIAQPGLPSIVLAASNAIELKRHALGLGAADYIVRVPYPAAAGKSSLARVGPTATNRTVPTGPNRVAVARG